MNTATVPKKAATQTKQATRTTPRKGKVTKTASPKKRRLSLQNQSVPDDAPQEDVDSTLVVQPPSGDTAEQDSLGEQSQMANDLLSTQEPPPPTMDEKLAQIHKSVPEFVEILKQRSEQKRKADMLRFTALQECVSRLARNLELESEKRETFFRELEIKLDDEFRTVLETAINKYEEESKKVDAQCTNISQRLAICKSDLEEKETRICKTKILFDQITQQASEMAVLYENTIRMWEDDAAAQQATLTELVRSIEQQTREMFAKLRSQIATLQQAIKAFDTFHTECQQKMATTTHASIEEITEALQKEEEDRTTHFNSIVTALHDISQNIHSGIILSATV